MDKLLNDIRFGVRSLVKSPRFAVAAVLTLALGIGANTAMFSVIRSVLMRPWPFPHPGRLLYVSQRQANGAANLFSTQDFLDWKQQGGLLAHMGAHVSWQFNIGSPGEPPQRISGGVVSYDFLLVLGAQPLLGQLFSAQQDTPGAGQFVMLSYAFWKNRFGADPHIAGKPMQIDGMPYTVVGVMPAGFNGFDGKELLWTLLQLRRDSGIGSSPNVHWLSACIRLPDGVSLKQARSATRCRGSSPAPRKPEQRCWFWRLPANSRRCFHGRRAPRAAYAYGLRWLRAPHRLRQRCQSVARPRSRPPTRNGNTHRARSVPASRIVRQLLTESVLLAGAGGAAGIAIAFLLLRGVLAIPSSLRSRVSTKPALTPRSSRIPCWFP